MNMDSTQQEIVLSNSKNIIVSAGAGSGKTRVLTERIKHLLTKGVRPDNIVAITFTNKAANEMKARLYNVPGIGDAFIGTIHSFANKIYRNSGTPYQILTHDLEIDIMKNLIGVYAKFCTVDDYMRYIDIKRDIDLGIRDERDMNTEFLPSVLHEISVFYGKTLESESEEYPMNLYKVCAQRNIITFNELLEECTKYFESIGGSLEYLLVDELQDIGNLEYQFLMSLNAENNFFVGDDWQSIYGFKGGDVRIFIKLMQNPDWTSYYLSNNYRNSRNILDVAKTVIDQASGIINKEIVPIRDSEGTVKIDSKYNLALYLKYIRDCANYKDWFILVRSNKDIVEVAKMLAATSIPYISFKQGQDNGDVDMKLMLDSVKLLTVHAAKGLESKNVILYGNFPIHQSSYMRNSDERKVMYVGITRAEDYLVILN